jgi:predicted DNA-binding protein
MSVKKSITIPEELQERLDKYYQETPKWKQFNQSQICADALDRKLKEEGF